MIGSDSKEGWSNVCRFFTSAFAPASLILWTILDLFVLFWTNSPFQAIVTISDQLGTVWDSPGTLEPVQLSLSQFSWIQLSSDGFS